MRTIEAADDLKTMLAAERAILFKHSTSCTLSALAWHQVTRFVEKFPAAAVFVINVLEHGQLSSEAETRLGVRHETPQAILVERGKAIQTASHLRVRLKTLSKWWER